jgi:hypothetical protein
MDTLSQSIYMSLHDKTLSLKNIWKNHGMDDNILKKCICLVRQGVSMKINPLLTILIIVYALKKKKKKLFIHFD